MIFFFQTTCKRSARVSSNRLKDEADPNLRKEFQIVNKVAPKDIRDTGPGSNLRMSSTGPLKLYLPALPCDPDLKIRLQSLPSQYQLTFSENGDRVSIVVDLDGKVVPMNQVTGMILADMKRVCGYTAGSPDDSGATTVQTNLATSYWHKLFKSWCPPSLWARHPLAEKEWYKQLKNSVYYEVKNCHRISECSGIVLVFITPSAHNRYTNLEMPGLAFDLYRAYNDGVTPFYDNGKEVIPYKYIDYRRCGIDDLSNNLRDISNAKKAASIVSCSNEDWTEADSIAKEWKATWLAKQVTDQDDDMVPKKAGS